MDTGITPLTPEQEAEQELETRREGYVHRVLVAFDQFANVVLGGEPDETISSRSARAATEGKWWGILMSKFLDLFQRDHGADAEAGDLERAKEVESLEEDSGTLPKEKAGPHDGSN